MTENTRTEPMDLDKELEALREKAAEVRAQLPHGVETWEAVKAIEARATAGWHLADMFTGLDVVATASKRAPRAWQPGRELSDAEAADLVERYPDLASLGDNWVRRLAGLGVAPFQMVNLVRQVQGRKGMSELKSGDVVEATLSGGTPRTVRLRLDRAPWPIGPDATTVSDGQSVTAVVTSSIRVVEDDGTTTVRLVDVES